MNKIIVNASGALYFNDKQYRCALGKGGARIDKQEGDGATPSDVFRLEKYFIV